MILVPDVSFYDDDTETPRHIDFTQMKSSGINAVFIRAGQNLWVDKSFVQSWKDAKLAGLKRGSYWFYDSRVDPIKQADLWYSLLKDDPGEMEAWADFEEHYNGSYAGGANFLKFCLRLKELGLKVGVYTGYYYWRENVAKDLAIQFAQFPLWIAWYNPPPVLLPAPWTSWKFWQFTENYPASVMGVESKDIDMSYYYGTPENFMEEYGEKIIQHIYSRRFDSDIHTVIVPKGTKVQMYASGSRQTVLTMAQKTGAKVAVNGGDYNPYTGDPTGILAVNGLVRSGFEETMPWLNITAQNEIQINEYNAKETPYNAVAGRRMLVVEGKQSDKTSAAWKEIHPKTFFGVNANGDLIIITADGRTEKSRGVDLYEGAQLLIEAGAVRGFDGGGGGDTTLVIDGQVANVPIADRTPGELRPVADGVMVFGTVSETQPPTTGETMDKWYKIDVTQNERETSTMFETRTRTGKPAGTVVKVVGGTLKKDTSASLDTLFAQTELPSANNADGWWQPLYYKGQWFAHEVPDPNAGTPDPTAPTVTHTIETYTDGSITIDGILYN